MPEMRYLKNVVTLELDREKCFGCKMCTVVCPHAVFEMDDSKRAIIADKDACMECGACQNNCPADAIEVQTGVGCAAGVIIGFLTGTGPNCDCTKGSCCG